LFLGLEPMPSWSQDNNSFIPAPGQCMSFCYITLMLDNLHP
jgi:hypothetical protein